MLTVSKAFNDAFRSDKRQIYARITLKNKVYTNDNLNEFVYEGGSFAGENLQIGSTFSNSVRITFCEIIEGLKQLDELKMEIGIKTTNGIEYVSMGIFLIDTYDPQRNDNRTVLECFDRMIMMNGSYESKLTYPARIRDVALEIANLSGVVVNTTSFGRLSSDVMSKLEGYTYRQALGAIAQFSCSYVRFDRNGLLDIRGLEDPEYTISMNEYFSKGLIKSETMYRIGGVSCKISDDSEVENLHRGSKTGNQIILENQAMNSTYLDAIYQKLRNTNYYPFSLNWRGNPALEAGDWITIVDKEGKRFKVPNLSYSITFNGGITARSSADTNAQAETTAGYTGNLQQQLDDMNAWLTNNAGNNIYGGLDEPKYPKEGDIWFKPNGPDTEIWVYEKISDTEYGWVFKISTALDPSYQDMIDDINDKIEQGEKDIEEALVKAEDATHQALEAHNKAIAAQEDALQIANDIKNLGHDIEYVQTELQDKASQSQVTQLSNQITSVISDVEGNKSAIVQLNNQITSVVSDVEGNKTEISQLNNQIVSIVSTVDGHSSQITQLNNQINLKVSKDEVTAEILKDKQILDTRNDNQPPSWYWSNYAKQTVREFKLRTIIGLTNAGASGSYAQLETVVPMTSSAYGQITQTARTNDGTWQRKSTSDSAWGVWAKIADSSNVISQINISTEGIIISGAKVQITGDTYIQNAAIKTAHIANAAITDAKIATLSANKINTGTLNAANVNIINLNASNIASGTLNAIDITGASIRTANNNGYFRLYGNVMYGYNVSGNIRSYYGITGAYWHYSSTTTATVTRKITIETTNRMTFWNNDSGIAYTGTIYMANNGDFYLQSSNQIRITATSSIIVYSTTQFYSTTTFNSLVSFGANINNTNTNIIIYSGSYKIKYLSLVASTPYIHFETSNGTYGVTAWKSDVRLKKDIELVDESGLELINKMQVKKFEWKDTAIIHNTRFGLIAQDLLDILPESVFLAGDYYQIKAESIIPAVIKAVQELDEKVETEVQKLQNRVNTLENKLRGGITYED